MRTLYGAVVLCLFQLQLLESLLGRDELTVGPGHQLVLIGGRGAIFDTSQTHTLHSCKPFKSSRLIEG